MVVCYIESDTKKDFFLFQACNIPNRSMQGGVSKFQWPTLMGFIVQPFAMSLKLLIHTVNCLGSTNNLDIAVMILCLDKI